MARYWLHNGFLDMRGEKMSKSLGNVVRVPDALDGGARARRCGLHLLGRTIASPLTSPRMRYESKRR